MPQHHGSFWLSAHYPRSRRSEAAYLGKVSTFPGGDMAGLLPYPGRPLGERSKAMQLKTPRINTTGILNNVKATHRRSKEKQRNKKQG